MAAKLRAELGLRDPDGTYQTLLDMIDGLDAAQSSASKVSVSLPSISGDPVLLPKCTRTLM